MVQRRVAKSKDMDSAVLVEPASMAVSAGDPFDPFGVLAVGTTNKCKLAAVEAVLQKHAESSLSFLAGAVIQGHKVKSEVSEQPMTLEETYQGAMNRARNAYSEARAANSSGSILALGLESGLTFSSVDGRAYDVCVCSAFDGTTFNQGMSCAFEIPPAILRYVVEEGMDLSQASLAAGVTANPALGEAEGLIGILSRGRVTRLDYTIQAINMALLPFESGDLYLRPGVSTAKTILDAGEALTSDGIVTPLRNGLRVKAPASGHDVLRIEAERRDCTERLTSAARGRSGTEFHLPLCSLLAAFGTGDDAQASHFANCSQSVDQSGRRTVVVDGESAVQAILGDSPLSASIGRLIVEHDGASTAKMTVERAKGQSSLAASLANGSRPTAQSLAAAAALEAAASSQKDPFVVESDVSDHETESARKRQRTEV